MIENDHDILILLSDVARMLRTEADRRARSYSMTRAQWILLSRLESQPGLSQKALAEILEVEPITIARLVDRLEARGLVERRPDPADRRIWRLHLLPEAEPVLADLAHERDALVDQLTAGLDRAALDQIGEGLARMRATLSRRPELEEAA